MTTTIGPTTGSRASRRRRGFRALAAATLLAPTLAWSQGDLRPTAGFSSGNRFEQKTGQQIYEGICQGCHMADAKGAEGAGRYPALAADPRLATPLYPAIILLKGSRAMPSFGDTLDDEQIAAVINYLRTHFGNAYPDAIDAAAVKQLRGP